MSMDKGDDKDDSFSSLDNLNIVEEDEAAAMPAVVTTDTALTTYMSQSPLCQGYLFKESSVHKAFNKRYFVLYQHLLVYYREIDQFVKDSTPEARLKHASGVIYLDDCYLTKPDALPYGARFCFILHTPHKENKRKSFKLVSKTKQDKHMWINLLQAQNPKLCCDPSSTTHQFQQVLKQSMSDSESVSSIDLENCKELCFKVDSCHFINPRKHRSMSEVFIRRKSAVQAQHKSSDCGAL